MQSGKLCRTYVMNVGTFSRSRPPFTISRIEQTGRKLPYKLFTSVYFIVLEFLGEYIYQLLQQAFMSYFLSSRDDLFYPRGISTVLESPKFYGNWKTFEKRYTRTAITRRHHLICCEKCQKRTSVYNTKRLLLLFVSILEFFGRCSLCIFQQTASKISLVSTTPNDTFGTAAAKKQLRQRNFSLSLCYSLSFSHFSPLNFFHYVFVKKAERSKEKSGGFFPLVELTP